MEHTGWCDAYKEAEEIAATLDEDLFAKALLASLLQDK